VIRRKNASSIGITGNQDEANLKFIKEITRKKIRKIVRKGKTIIVIGGRYENG
jgi:uncharacterized phage-like protein YoqJ